MKILFASMPMDGHFNPLTGLAVHLRKKGHDVRWYTAPLYAEKLAGLGVPHFSFERATDVNGENLTERFPEYEKIGNGPKGIAFALEKIFFGNLEAHYRDVCALREEFPFEAMVFDVTFYAARLVSEKLGVRGYAVMPSLACPPTSTEMPPPFFGLKPAKGPLGKVRDRIVGSMIESTMKGGMKILHDLRKREGLPPYHGSVFDLHVDTARAIYRIGVPGMDFPSTKWPKNVRFVGALMPHKKAGRALPAAVDAKLSSYPSVVVVSQGTIDNRDPTKLFVPSLEALRGSSHLVVATTGGRHTEDLRARFPDENVLVEDWLDFDLLLSHADVFVCNGGYGSVMQALTAGVPILAAGTLEGKNDVNARLDFRELGVDLKTERPKPRQIRQGVSRVLGDPRYRDNVARVRAELETVEPLELIEQELLRDAATDAVARCA